LLGVVGHVATSDVRTDGLHAGAAVIGFAPRRHRPAVDDHVATGDRSTCAAAHEPGGVVGAGAGRRAGAAAGGGSSVE
jgi:hypothetical protein